GFAMMELADREASAGTPEQRVAATKAIEQKLKVVLEDIAIAEQRGRSKQIADMVADIRSYVVAWPKAAADARLASGADAAELAAARDKLGERIRNELEILVQIAADEGFVFR